MRQTGSSGLSTRWHLGRQETPKPFLVGLPAAPRCLLETTEGACAVWQHARSLAHGDSRHASAAPIRPAGMARTRSTWRLQTWANTSSCRSRSPPIPRNRYATAHYSEWWPLHHLDHAYCDAIEF
eukprot:289075-Chlamydomonas_euryale.AAC.6